MSYKSYMPWARNIISNDKKNDKAKDQSGNEQSESKDITQDSGYRSRYGLGSSSASSTSRTSDTSSASASTYRPGSYRSSLASSSYTPRDRSTSGERFSSSYLPSRDTKPPETPSYTRPSYARSNSTLSERENNDSDSKKTLGVSGVYGSYNRYGRSPSKTVNYDTLEEKSSNSKAASPAPRTESTAFKYTSNPYTSSISSRFLATRKDSTPILPNTDASTEGRYTYRTRPQPAIKKLEIPSKNKSDINTTPNATLSPTSLSPTSITPAFPKNTEPEESKPYPQELPKNLPCTISVVTRGTSPNPPSQFVRTRRSELAREIQRDVARPIIKPDSRNQHTQTEKIEETSRFSRYGTRTSTPWSSYLDRYSSPSSSYSPVSRYSSKFSNIPSGTESPKSSIMSSRPSRISIETANSKSTVTAADKLKDSINSLVATLQTSPLGTPIREIPTISESVDKRTSPIKLNIKEKSPEKFKIKEKSKSPEKIKVLRKSSSPEKLSRQSPDKNIKRRSPEKNKSIETKIETQIKQSQSKSDIRKSPSKTNEPIKIAKLPSKTNLAVRRSSKDASNDSQDLNTTKATKSIPSSLETSPKVAHKENIILKIGSKTDLTSGENSSSSSPKTKPKVVVLKSLSKDKIARSPSKNETSARQTSAERSILQTNVENESKECKNSEPDTVDAKSGRSRITPIKFVAQNESTDTTDVNDIIQNGVATHTKNDNSVISLVPELKIGVYNTDRKSRSNSPQLVSSANNSQQESLDRSPITSRKPPKSPEINAKFDQKPLLDNNQCTKLPPPSPKTTSIKTSNSLNAITKPRLPNKDFRKSPLNMSNSEEKSKILNVKQKAISAGNSPLTSHKPINLTDNSTSTNTSETNCNILRKTKSTTSGNLGDELLSEKKKNLLDKKISSIEGDLLNDISGSDDKLKRNSDTNEFKSQTKFIRRSSSSRRDSSSTASGSTSDEEAQDEEEDEEEEEEEQEETSVSCDEASSEEKEGEIQRNVTNNNNQETKDSGLCKETNVSNEKLQKLVKSSSFKRSHSHLLSRTDSGTSEDPCSSLPVDPPPIKEKATSEKPPLPSSSKVKEEPTSKAASFLMRALAPVTNLFSAKNKHDSVEKDVQEPGRDEIRRSETFQSISEIHDEIHDAEPVNKQTVDLEQWLDKNNKTAFIKGKRKKSSKKELNEPSESQLKVRENEKFWFESTDENQDDNKAASMKKVDSLIENKASEEISNDINTANKTESNIENIKIDNKAPSTPTQDNLEEPSKPWTRPISCEIGWWLKDDDNKQDENIIQINNTQSNSKSNEVSEVSGEKNLELEVEKTSKSDLDVKSTSESNKNEQQIVRKVFRSDSGEHSWLLDSTEDISEEDSEDSDDEVEEEEEGEEEEESDSESVSEDDELRQPKQEAKRFTFRRVESGERAWWMQSTDNVPEGIARIESSASLSKSLSKDQLKYRIRPQVSGDRAWWMQSSDNVPEGIKREQSKDSIPNSNTEKIYKIRHIESGEKAWWMQSNENVPEGIQRNQSGSSVSKSEEPVAVRYRIRPQQSGERAWWMQSTENVPEGLKREESNNSIAKSQTSLPIGRRIRRNESREKAWWMQSEENVALNEGVKRNRSIRSLTKTAEPVQRSESLRSNDSKNKFGRRIRRIESGEKAWWMESNSDIPEGVKRIESNKSLNISNSEKKKMHSLRPQPSGEIPWWLDSSADIPEGITRLPPSSSDSEEESSENEEKDKQTNPVPKFPLTLGDRTSPDGLDTSQNGRNGRTSPYDNVAWLASQDNEKEEDDDDDDDDDDEISDSRKGKKNMKLFIGSHTNIDDILGCSEQPPVLLSPIEVVRELTERFQKQESKEKSPSDESEEESSSDEEQDEKASNIFPDVSVKSPEKVPQQDKSPVDEHVTEPKPEEQKSENKLDDASLQLYKDGDYGSYLDLEASLSEQHEEFEGFHINRKNSIVLRTQLSVRVHTIIEKLLTSEGRELRRALFSLKQIFQEDKDLVHEFVQNDGLACLVKVGSGADQNFQNYILRALGQVMLYVDGMNGVMAHNETIQWLYTLIASNFRLVVKTALKLLLVFVEYKESNCMLLIRAIHKEDSGKKQVPWTNVMKLLSDYDTLDTELLVYACTLVNKTLNGLPDQDSYYDQVDSLEEQGMEAVIQRYMSRQGTDLDLLRQFQIYEAVLHYEDGEEKGTPLRQLDEAIRKTLKNRKASPADSPNERRKSRRHSSTILPIKGGLNSSSGPQLICSPLREKADNDEGSSSSSRSSPSPSLGGDLHHNLNGGSYADNNKANVGVTPALRRRRERAERQRSFIREQQESAAILRKSADKSGDEDNQLQNGGERDTENWQPNNNVSRTPSRQDVLMNAMNKLQDSELDGSGDRSEERKILQLTRENTVKDLTQKLANSNIVLSPSDDKVPRLGDMTGIISKAMEGLAKSKSKGEIKPSESQTKIAEVKKSETELHWENLLENMDRPLQVCDLDFTDLNSEDELDILAPSFINKGIPPPPPPISSMMPPPPPSLCTPPAPPGAFGSKFTPSPADTPSQSEKTVKKSKKTVKLFWKEVREDPATIDKLQKTGLNLIWDELSPVSVDTQKLEHLFESRAKDIAPKKQQELNKSKEIIVLDPKRSNAINIGMTKLPPPRSIKTAILKMDSTVMNREGIEKLFAMLPTEEERAKIQEAQVANPDIPLGSAEQFLLTLASISELPARLKLWAFKLDYDNIEREVAEPVMDLKQGMQILKSNRTFRSILGTLLSIGIFLNGNEVKGFQIEYLAKVPEVKDTVHKHSLLHHLCHMVMEKFPDSTDLYSEIGAVTRASKIDFEELAKNIHRLESECKASWEHLKVIAKHDGASATKNKMSDFLTECAQRIILLEIIHRRVINRFHNFLLWLGTPPHRITDTKPNEFCRIVSEFALEYRTTRERVLQQLEKKANHRERNKTRGKMITEVGKFRSKEVDRKDAELRQLLGGDISDTESIHGTWRRHRKPDTGRTGTGLPEQMDGDDEILESLVKTATKSPATRTTPRERKRTRHADRKSLRRTLKNGLSEEEKKHLAAYIKGY